MAGGGADRAGEGARERGGDVDLASDGGGVGDADDDGIVACFTVDGGGDFEVRGVCRG